MNKPDINFKLTDSNIPSKDILGKFFGSYNYEIISEIISKMSKEDIHQDRKNVFEYLVQNSH